MTAPIPVQLASNESPGQTISRYVIKIGLLLGLRPWVVMLIVGAAHSWWPGLPSISFVQALLLILAVGALLPDRSFDDLKYKWDDD